MAVVSGTAGPLRLADAALVVAEHRNAGVDERHQHAAEAQALFWARAVDPYDSRVRTGARREIQRALLEGVATAVVDDDLLMARDRDRRSERRGRSLT